MEKPYPPVEYQQYLGLAQLLDSQHPKSVEYGRPAHDELLFIVVHQVYELWFKQILHELDSVIALFRPDSVDERNIGVAVSRLHRVTEIQKLLVDQLRVLETMTPLDFLDFRDMLLPASGFQSRQFRAIESRLGVRRDQPSLFDLVEKWLERTPFLELPGFQFWASYRAAVEPHARRRPAHDRDAPRAHAGGARRCSWPSSTARAQSFEALLDEPTHERLRAEGSRRLSHRATLAALLIHLYRDQPILHLPFRFLTLLVDVDELLATWRYRHALMVHRMIGTKIGTGGSVGAPLPDGHGRAEQGLRGPLQPLDLPDPALGAARPAARPGAAARLLLPARLAVLALKAHYSRFLGARPGVLHFAAHSHHLWPDVTRDAAVPAWDDAARLADQKWDHVLGVVLPRVQGHVARILGFSRPEQIAFAPNTHELVSRVLSCFAPGRALRVLTTDGEFMSFSRQLARLEESGEVRATRVPTEPFETFDARFRDAASAARGTSST